MTDDYLSRWRSPDWLAEVAGWAASALAQQDEAPSGPLAPIHLEPWSTVMRVPAGARTYFFKATHPARTYEVGLTQALGEWLPAYCDRPVAADPARGWLLLGDGGPTVRQAFGAQPAIEWWTEILRRYAHLQIATVPRAGQLIALGLPDRRPTRLAALFLTTHSLHQHRGSLWLGRG